MHSSQWLRHAGRGDRSGIAGVSGRRQTGDWPQLWALLCGLALTVPPGDPQSETAKLARETFPDIKDPYETVLAEAAQAAKLLADRGLTAGLERSADGSRAAGNPLIACDAYGSRYLLVAPFGYDGEEVDHWYAWGQSTRAGSSTSSEPGCTVRPRTPWPNGSTPSAPPPGRNCRQPHPR